MNETWIVYRHTSPSGKVYIGITSRSAEERWGKNGYGYKRQRYFSNAIRKYGWQNFKHEILHSKLPEHMAKAIEAILVKYYKDLGISYNVADGGGVGTKGCKWTHEQLTNKPIRDMKGSNNPNYGNHKVAGKNNPMYGKTQTEDARRRISIANTGKTRVRSQMCEGPYFNNVSTMTGVTAS